MEHRLNFATNFVSRLEMWDHVIFNEEDKFNLYGPDGFNYYWHDSWNERRILPLCPIGGRGIMMSAAIKNGERTGVKIKQENIKKC